MSKEKRAADLDAELAALEAELAALEAGARTTKAKGKDKAKPKTPDSAADAPAAPKKFGLPFGLKKKAPIDAAPAPDEHAVPVPVPEATPTPTPTPKATAPPADLSLWRQDGSTWIRTVPGVPTRTVRRILDEEGTLVREEAASGAEVDRVDAVKAERGIGRLFRRKGA